MKEYQYDVFLSFTGADRELKNSLREHLEAQGLHCYDSDLYCNGQFRSDYCEALDKSRVYLLILSDNLRNDPIFTSKGTLTDVRSEVSLARNLESANELNIVILCMSEFFRFANTYHEYDSLGWFFYSNIQGFSQIYGKTEEDGRLSAETLSAVGLRCKSFVDRRIIGKPVISQCPKIEIAEEKILRNDDFQSEGREKDISAVLDAFKEGKQLVILSGMGGIGKTALAIEIARQCEETEFLKCPQIIRMQDFADASEGLGPLVYSVNYTEAVYSSLSSLSDREKYERRLAALRGLPETVLLVIDNYNTLTKRDIDELTSKLKCRILITTRARFEIQNSETYWHPVVGLEPDPAYRMFCTMLGKTADRSQFDILYSHIKGHTITLCIIAKMMAAHKMEISDIIKELSGSDDGEAKITFTHHDRIENTTVMGHLKNLFGIVDLSENSKRILRSMSLLSDGCIATRVLMEILGLKNRNEIIELTDSGWLEGQSFLSDGETQEMLYLHPVISLLMVNTLKPTVENTAETIDYIIKETDKARKRLTYSAASVLEDRLYFACLVLAGSSKTLADSVWSRFVDLNHLSGDVEGTQTKLAKLSLYVSDAKSIEAINSYGDMIFLEQYPSRIDILDKYVEALTQNSANYKWVMQALSVTLTHIGRVKKYSSALAKILTDAIDAAMLMKDDLALLDLFGYSLSVNRDSTSLINRLTKYVKVRKAEEEPDSNLLTLELMLTTIKIFSSKNLADFFESAAVNINDLLNGKYFNSYKMMLTHPITFARANRILAEIESFDGSDPLSVAIRIAIEESENFANDEPFDMMRVIKAAVAVHIQKLQNNQTLASADKAVENILAIFNALPTLAVRKAAETLTGGVDMENISVQGLSDLQIASLINQNLGDRAAVRQSLLVVEATRRLRPAGHNDILHALMSYGNVCITFGRNQEGIDAYLEVCRQLMARNPDSSVLEETAKKLLPLDFTRDCSVEFVSALKDLALRGYAENDINYHYYMGCYALRLINMAHRGQIDYTHSAMEELLSYFEVFAAKCNRYNLRSQTDILRYLDDMIYFSCRDGSFDTAERLLAAVNKMKKSRRNAARRFAHVVNLRGRHRINLLTTGVKDLSLLYEALSFTVKKQVSRVDACLTLWHIIRDMKSVDSLEEFFAQFVTSPRLVKELCEDAENWYSLCVPDWIKQKHPEFEEDRQSHDGFIIANIENLFSKNINSGAGIPAKDYSKLKTAEEFCYIAFSVLLKTAVKSKGSK